MLRVLHLSDAYIRCLFSSTVPGKMNFSSVPEILLAFSYPDLRDIKVNNISVGYLECCHSFFTGKVLPQTIVFPMLEAPVKDSSFVWCCETLFVCGGNICFFLCSYSFMKEESSLCSARILYSLQFSRLLIACQLALFLFRV